MTIDVSKSLSVEFDQDSIEEGSKLFQQLREKSSDDTLNGLFAVLLFWRLEQSKPGTVATLMTALGAQQP